MGWADAKTIARVWCTSFGGRTRRAEGRRSVELQLLRFERESSSRPLQWLGEEEVALPPGGGHHPRGGRRGGMSPGLERGRAGVPDQDPETTATIIMTRP